jgi:hypothetical protein
MNISAYNDYLYDNKFSSDLHVQYPRQDEVADKLEYIKGLIQGKRLVDVGFADHYDLIDIRLRHNEWLHAHFRNWTSGIIGVDIDPKAVGYIKEKMGYPDIYCHDITGADLLQPIMDEQWDYLLLSEVLEHIPDPAYFLRRIRENYGGRIKKIIITVPNAYGTIYLRSVWKGVERINSDHKFWFTPYTLSKVVIAAGLKIEDFRPCNSYYKLSWWERMLVKRSPLFHHTLAMVASF